MTGMTTTKPYLFRAILEWIEDNSLTPHVVVDALGQGVLVPQEYVKDGQIILNISSSSIQLYQMDNSRLHFSARFNGVSQELSVPIASVLGIYARENGQGMFFDPEDYPEEETNEPENQNTPITEVEVVSNKTEKEVSKSKKKGKRDSKGNGSHLKVIK